MRLWLQNLTVHGTKVRLLGFLKSVFFQFYKGSFELYAIENGIQGSPISVSPSAHNYYLSHEPTQRFWKFEYECDAREVQNLWFKLNLIQRSLRQAIILCRLFQFCGVDGIYQRSGKNHIS